MLYFILAKQKLEMCVVLYCSGSWDSAQWMRTHFFSFFLVGHMILRGQIFIASWTEQNGIPAAGEDSMF